MIDSIAPANEMAAARRAMVESQLRPEGVTDPVVLAAMSAVPREDYVPAEWRAMAYSDRQIPVGNGESMMPPAALGQLLSRLAPRPGERALVVGGDRYAAAVVEAMGLMSPTEGESADLILLTGSVPSLPADLVARLTPTGRIGGAIDDKGITRLFIARAGDGGIAADPFVDAAVAPLPQYQPKPQFRF